MLTIHMAGGFGISTSFGPAPFFELDRESLRQGPHRKVIARHVRNAWVVSGRHFSSFEVNGPVLAIFSDTAKPPGGCRVLGPFSHLRLANGFAFADARPVAEFEETIAQWCARQEPDCWPVIELRALDNSQGT
jgi:hypothetical protein